MTIEEFVKKAKEQDSRNYFEPFEQRNVKIEIAYKTKGDNYVAFKADSDQDRPNIL